MLHSYEWMKHVAGTACVFKSVLVWPATTDEEGLSPGPDGRLISTDERMQAVRQAQSESPAPASTDGQLT